MNKTPDTPNNPTPRQPETGWSPDYELAALQQEADHLATQLQEALTLIQRWKATTHTGP